MNPYPLLSRGSTNTWVNEMGWDGLGSGGGQLRCGVLLLLLGMVVQQCVHAITTAESSYKLSPTLGHPHGPGSKAPHARWQLVQSLPLYPLAAARDPDRDPEQCNKSSQTILKASCYSSASPNPARGLVRRGLVLVSLPGASGGSDPHAANSSMMAEGVQGTKLGMCFGGVNDGAVT
eukprot:CAMPEP_0173431322 /NCGR_PEP_ID=MMETSP1357-20121228/9496_1 /TAXON_ID=77926 /ORGANISM="Hemiselmis rufescens, Strain PCC563" /LENGTH=176 /DNA_ID=CAMNT_0014395783 /DNA_START=32 /DNA_END=560 /DNA_ORIENTATION=-